MAEQKVKKIHSFLLRCLFNCGRVPIFAPQSRTKASQIGRLAQLVQSVCLTSRGSGVRIPQRPHSFRQLSIGRWVAVFFACEGNARGWGSVCKFGGRLCAYPALAGSSVACFCVGGGRMQFFARAFAPSPKFLVSPPRETGRWVALFSEKDGEKKRKDGRC